MYAYGLCLKDFMRIGSSEVTFKRPDRDGEFFRDLTDHHGFELRAYCDQALFSHSPGKNILITDIVN